MKLLSYCITLLTLLSIAMAVHAEGPAYEKGSNLLHSTTCTPPTSREPDAEGTVVPILPSELVGTTLSLYKGGGLFTTGTLIESGVAADIYCTHNWQIDDYASGQYYVFATITDTENRTSRLSVSGGPFSSFVVLMPPSPPVINVTSTP